MAVNGNKARIMRNLPMSPGIDLAGIVSSTSNNNFKKGDEVIVTGWGLGETHSGGYSQIVRVNSDWLIKKPNNISLKHSMSVGTAGLTAMLSLIELEKSGITNSSGEIVVTGAGGFIGRKIVLELSKNPKNKWRPYYFLEKNKRHLKFLKINVGLTIFRPEKIRAN